MSIAGPPSPGKQIGLALSGGGVRAAAFHLGVIKRLAHESLLESVSAVSTVSGGSLATAAIFSEAGTKWPSSERYIQTTYLTIRKKMTSVDLFGMRAIGWSGLRRWNIGLLRQRGTALAALLEENWGVNGRVRDLPDTPPVGHQHDLH
jgi:NTE family protein